MAASVGISSATRSASSRFVHDGRVDSNDNNRNSRTGVLDTPGL
jgi:hypothetical protein